jgi:hypothetical protein
VPSLLGNEGGCHHPAVVVFVPQITIEPVATRPRFVDKDQVCGLGLHVSDELVNVTMAGADGAEVDDLGVVAFSHISDGNGLFMPIQSSVLDWGMADLRLCVRFRPEAALASKKLTRASAPKVKLPARKSLCLARKKGRDENSGRCLCKSYCSPHPRRRILTA